MFKYICCNLMINYVSTQICMTALKKEVIFLKRYFSIQLNLRKGQWKAHEWIYFFEPNQIDHDLLPPRLKKDQFDIQGAYNIINSVFVNSSLEMKAISLPTGIIWSPFGLLLRFRMKKIGLVSDIEKAFLEVGPHEADRGVTRFLWLKDIQNPVSKENLIVCRFKRRPFEIISSPFLLGSTIKHH